MGKAPKYLIDAYQAQPLPPQSEAARIEQQALRMRLLRGQQEPDVRAEVEADFDPAISYDLAFRPDLSENSFANCWQQLAIAYDTYPTVTTDEDHDLSSLITPDLWPLCQTRELYQLAINEALIRCDWPTNKDDPQEVKYRVVDPSLIYGMRADRDHPDRPVYVCELRSRTREGDGGEMIDVWTYEKWQIGDDPKFWIEEIRDGVTVDVTSEYVGILDDYPYRDKSGAPILPYVLYHSKIQSRLWDYMRGIELVRGTLRLSSFYCWFADCFKNGANPIRCAIDLDLPAGSSTTLKNGKPLQTVAASPKTIIKFQSTIDRSGSIATFPPGLDPETALESLRRYAERLAVYAGISPADLQRTGSPQSGIAIVVSRDGMRRAQLKAEPANRKGDGQLLALAARLSNAYADGSGNLPENPRAYRINYGLVGQSDFERKVTIENIGSELAMGTLSPVQAVRALHPEIETTDQAVAYLLEVGEQTAALEAAKAESPQGDQPNTQGRPFDGAQVTAAQNVISAVQSGAIPRDTGIEMLSMFFSMDQNVAIRLLGSAGTTTNEGA